MVTIQLEDAGDCTGLNVLTCLTGTGHYQVLLAFFRGNLDVNENHPDDRYMFLDAPEARELGARLIAAADAVTAGIVEIRPTLQS